MKVGYLCSKNNIPGIFVQSDYRQAWLNGLVIS